MLSVSILHSRQCCCWNSLRIRCPVKAAAGCVLRTMGDVAVCLLSAFLTVLIELQLVKLENMLGKVDLTLYISMTVTGGFYFFYKLFC